MALITKPDFTYVWASGGAVVAPNDTKKQLGWVAEAPPFQYDNWLQNRQDQMLAHINQRGIPAWDGLTEYEAGGLSYVQGSDGKVYKSVAASGPSATVQNPTTDGTDTYWTIAFADFGASLTQTAGDARYTQRSNNLSDVSNTATARTNLGVVAASTTTQGLVELSTNAEAQTASSSTLAVTPSDLGATVIGINQTWQNVTASRVAGTTYTNTTGRPIMVCVGTSGAGFSGIEVSVNGLPVIGSTTDSYTGTDRSSVSVVIPNANTYSITADGTITWLELR